MSDWQPIATAPRDGTAVLLCHREGDISLASYDLYYAPGGYGYNGDDNAWRSIPDGEPVEQYFDEATHWMPLPPPAKPLPEET